MNTDKKLMFQGRAFEVFETTEINEAILMIYNEFSYAIRDNADTLVLNKNGLTHFSGNQIVGVYPAIEGTSLDQAFRQSILKITERDVMVQKYFKIVNLDENGLKLIVNKPHDSN